jgi:hypothetical protein
MGNWKNMIIIYTILLQEINSLFSNGNWVTLLSNVEKVHVKWNTWEHNRSVSFFDIFDLCDSVSKNYQVLESTWKMVMNGKFLILLKYLTEGTAENRDLSQLKVNGNRSGDCNIVLLKEGQGCWCCSVRRYRPCGGLESYRLRNWEMQPGHNKRL